MAFNEYSGGGGGGGGGGGTGSSFDASFNYYFIKKPDFVIDPSGKYDISDERIELSWELPKQTRAAPNFISAPTNSRQINVLSLHLEEYLVRHYIIQLVMIIKIIY